MRERLLRHIDAVPPDCIPVGGVPSVSLHIEQKKSCPASGKSLLRVSMSGRLGRRQALGAHANGRRWCATLVFRNTTPLRDTSSCLVRALRMQLIATEASLRERKRNMAYSLTKKRTITQNTACSLAPYLYCDLVLAAIGDARGKLQTWSGPKIE